MCDFYSISLDVGMHFVLPVISINSTQFSGKLEGRQPPVLTCSITAPARFWASGKGGEKEGDEMNCNKICRFSLSKVLSPSTTMEWE